MEVQINHCIFNLIKMYKNVFYEGNLKLNKTTRFSIKLK